MPESMPLTTYAARLGVSVPVAAGVWRIVEALRDLEDTGRVTGAVAETVRGHLIEVADGLTGTSAGDGDLVGWVMGAPDEGRALARAAVLAAALAAAGDDPTRDAIWSMLAVSVECSARRHQQARASVTPPP